MQDVARRLCAVAAVVVGLLGAGCTGDIAGSDMSDTPGPQGDEGVGAPRGTGGNPSGAAGSGGASVPVLPPGMRPATCKSASPGPAPIRRLTHREYEATMRALLGATGAAADLPPEEELLGFDNNAEG